MPNDPNDPVTVRRVSRPIDANAAASGSRPALIGLLRAVVSAALVGGIGVLITTAGDVTAGELAPWAPVAVLALRTLEGLIDNQTDPTSYPNPLGLGAPVEVDYPLDHPAG